MGEQLDWTQADAREGRRRRDEALERFEEVRLAPLGQVRDAMQHLFRRRRKLYGDEAGVTADDVRYYCDRAGIPRGKWMGAVFKKSAGWRADGRTKNSRDPIQHAALLKVWVFEK